MLAMYLVFIPHSNDPYPVHVDEWHHMANSKVIMETGDATAEVPYPPPLVVGQNMNLEAGFELFTGLFQEVSGLSWIDFIRYSPMIIFAFTVLTAYVFGRRHGFGWEAALMTCFITTTTGIMGPGFLVPVALGLPFVILSLYILFHFRGLWSYLVFLLLASFLLSIHPVTALILGFLIAPYILFSLKSDWKRGLTFTATMGIPFALSVWVADIGIGVSLLKLLFGYHEISHIIDWPDLIPQYGYLPTVCCILGVMLLVIKGGRENYGLAAGFILLLLVLVSYIQFNYGTEIIYSRGLLYVMLVMGLIGGFGLAMIRRIRLPGKFGSRAKSVFLIQNMGNMLCLVVIMLTSVMVIPDRQAISYYHKIDDNDYDAFVWINEYLGNEYKKAILDPVQAIPFVAITGKEVHSTMRSRVDSKARETYQFLKSDCTDTDFLKKNDISIVYNRNECNNPDLVEMKEDVYVLK